MPAHPRRYFSSGDLHVITTCCYHHQPILDSAHRRDLFLRVLEQMRSERKRVEKLRYMHRNPVKRGLVSSPEQWRGSSFRFYLYGEQGLVKVNDTGILLMTVHPPAA